MDISALIKRIDGIESNHRVSVFESLGRGDAYFETWEREIHPMLCEVAMDPAQVKQLFTSIEKNAGRSTLGKASDAVKGAKDKISDVWFNKFGGMLQSSGPVQAFDQKFEDIKSKISAKNPELAAKLAKYGEFAKNNPNLHKFLLAIAGSAAAALGVALAGGVGAGALAVGTGAGIATGIINIADRLLKGEKASTAIGRGATAGIVAGLTAGTLAKIGGWLAGMREQSIPLGDTGIEEVSYRATKTLKSFGMEMTEMVQGFKVAVNPEEASAVRAAMNLIQNGEVEGFNQLQDIASVIQSKEYKEGIKATLDAAKQVAFNNDSLLQWIKGVTKVASTVGAAGAGQAAAGVGEAPPAAPTPVAESLNRAQLNELFGITGNKVDASKLEKAWTKAGSPTDSEEIKQILVSAGVDEQLVATAFADLGIEVSSAAPAGETVNIQELLAQIAKLSAAEQKEILAYAQA